MLGFGLLIVISLSIAGFGMIGLSGVGASVTRMDLLAANVRRMSDTVRLLEVTRRAMTRYEADADERSRQEVVAAGQQMSALLTEAEKTALSDDRRQQYKTVGDMLIAFSAKRDRFFQAFGSGYAEQGKVFAAGDALAVATTGVLDASHAIGDPIILDKAERVEAAVLRLRVVTLRFFANIDPAGVPATKARLEQANAAIADLAGVASGEMKARNDQVRDALAAYARGFEAASTGLLAGAEF